MPTYETPGLFWEHLDTAGPAVAAARMDVPALVGIARRGPLGRAVPVESLAQFQAQFGGFTGAGYLAYAVKGFFDNGGRRAWIVRVAARETANPAAAAAIHVSLPAIPGLDAADTRWRIAASSPGVWGNGLAVTLAPGRRVATVGHPTGSSARSLKVPSVAGFARDTLVRVTQGAAGVLRVLAGVDAAEGLLHLVHPDPRLERATDLPLAAPDPSSPVRVEALRWTLTVRDGGRLVGLAEDLAPVPNDPRYGPTMLAPFAEGPGARSEADPPSAAPFPVTLEALSGPAPADAALDGAGVLVLPLAGGRDGLADLAADDFINALRVLDDLFEPAIVAIPDVCIRPLPPPEIEALPVEPPDPCNPCAPPEHPAPLAPRPAGDLPPVFSDADIARVQQAMVEHCEAHRDRFALIDPPFPRVSSPVARTTGLEDWRRLFDTRHAALYAPWITVVDPERPSETRFVPPSGHVAGQYALAEALGGVHRAPANRDLAWAEAASLAIDPARHGLLNGKGINVIKPGLGRPLRILGARTLSSDPDARYVPVRRLVMFLLRSFDRSTRWTVFEPNSHETRSALAHAIDGFLNALWREGALAGDTPHAAYAVRCDEGNNPPAERADGRLRCDVAVAPVVPYEFVVLRIGRVGNAIEIDERVVRPAATGGLAP